MRPVLFLMVFCLSPVRLIAQHVVTGAVVDEFLAPLPGVSIWELGTANGSTTDSDGKFRIVVSGKTTLTFFFIGYESAEVEIDTQTEIHVQLMPDVFEEDHFSFNIPRFRHLIKNTFPDLQRKVEAITADIIVMFEDSITKTGKAVYFAQDTAHSYYVSSVDLVSSLYGSPVSTITLVYAGIEFEGKIFPIPSELITINEDVAVVMCRSSPLHPDAIPISNKTSKNVYITDRRGQVRRLPVKARNQKYQELELNNRDNIKVPIGSPVFDKFGIIGFIADSQGKNVTTSVLNRFADSLQKEYWTTASYYGNSKKFGRTVNYKALLPRRIRLGLNLTNIRFYGEDLRPDRTALSPSIGAYIETTLWGFALAYEFSYNAINSKMLNSPVATYQQLQNTHYGHSLLVKRTLLGYKGFDLGGIGGLSLHTMDGLLINSNERVPLSQVIAENFDAKFRAFSIGLFLGLPTSRLLNSRHHFEIIALYNATDSPYIDLNMVDPSKTSTKNDAFLKFGLTYYYSIR